MKNKIELTAEIKYKLLRNISHKIQGTLDLDKILNLLLDLLANIIDYDAAGIFILSEDINHPGYHLFETKNCKYGSAWIWKLTFGIRCNAYGR